MSALPHTVIRRNTAPAAPLALFCLAALAASTLAGAMVRLDIEAHLVAVAILAQ